MSSARGRPIFKNARGFLGGLSKKNVGVQWLAPLSQVGWREPSVGTPTAMLASNTE